MPLWVQECHLYAVSYNPIMKRELTWVRMKILLVSLRCNQDSKVKYPLLKAMDLFWVIKDLVVPKRDFQNLLKLLIRDHHSSDLNWRKTRMKTLMKVDQKRGLRVKKIIIFLIKEFQIIFYLREKTYNMDNMPES